MFLGFICLVFFTPLVNELDIPVLLATSLIVFAQFVVNIDRKDLKLNEDQNIRNGKYDKIFKDRGSGLSFLAFANILTWVLLLLWGLFRPSYWASKTIPSNAELWFIAAILLFVAGLCAYYFAGCARLSAKAVAKLERGETPEAPFNPNKLFGALVLVLGAFLVAASIVLAKHTLVRPESLWDGLSDNLSASVAALLIGALYSSTWRTFYVDWQEPSRWLKFVAEVLFVVLAAYLLFTAIYWVALGLPIGLFAAVLAAVGIVLIGLWLIWALKLPALMLLVMAVFAAGAVLLIICFGVGRLLKVICTAIKHILNLVGALFSALGELLSNLACVLGDILIALPGIVVGLVMWVWCLLLGNCEGGGPNDDIIQVPEPKPIEDPIDPPDGEDSETLSVDIKSQLLSDRDGAWVYADASEYFEPPHSPSNHGRSKDVRAVVEAGFGEWGGDLCDADAVIVIGTASIEGGRNINEERARKRGDRLAALFDEGLSESCDLDRKPIVYRTSLGQYCGNDCTVNDEQPSASEPPRTHRLWPVPPGQEVAHASERPLLAFALGFGAEAPNETVIADSLADALCREETESETVKWSMPFDQRVYSRLDCRNSGSHGLRLERLSPETVEVVLSAMSRKETHLYKTGYDKYGSYVWRVSWNGALMDLSVHSDVLEDSDKKETE